MAKIKSHVELSDNLMIHVVKGELSTTDVLDIIQNICMKNPTRFIIWDILSGSLANISSEEINNLAHQIKHDMIKNISITEKIAIVVSKTLDFGLGRMYQNIAENPDLSIKYKICYSVEEAKSWMGI